MRTIIAGSRSISDYSLLETAVNLSGFEITRVISGHARGADKLGEMYAKKHKIPLQIFHPDWNRWGRSAGIRRNVDMAKNADALICLWDGISKGSAHMIRIAEERGLKVFVMKP